MYNSIWYNSLTKPFLTPSGNIFPPVWTVLYLTIFISFILFIAKTSFRSKLRGFLYFGIQMILNFVWPLIFFGLKSIGLGLVVIILLDIFLFLTIKEFYKISKSSAYLLIPYFMCVIFATYLNLGFLIIN